MQVMIAVNTIIDSYLRIHAVGWCQLPALGLLWARLLWVRRAWRTTGYGGTPCA